jgi:hypothetical protein
VDINVAELHQSQKRSHELSQDEHASAALLVEVEAEQRTAQWGSRPLRKKRMGSAS